nr:hypothetical protein Iba_chr05eCG17160 [Ipomoea batatas]
MHFNSWRIWLLAAVYESYTYYIWIKASQILGDSSFM